MINLLQQSGCLYIGCSCEGLTPGSRSSCCEGLANVGALEPKEPKSPKVPQGVLGQQLQFKVMMCDFYVQLIRNG